MLIGLHPTLTQFDLLDGTPGYQGVGAPWAVISAPTQAEQSLTMSPLFRNSY